VADISIDAKPKTLVLAQVLDIKAAISLAEDILSLRGVEIIIDASHVARLGGQSLQILLSAMTTWQADGLSIEFARPSASFVEGLALFGIAPGTLLSGADARCMGRSYTDGRA
jgi:chemotaxis protein CheX